MRSRDPRAALAFFFVANVLFAAGLYGHAFLYNFYLEELGLGAGVMGRAAAALTAGGLAALVPAGMLVDRHGARAGYLAAALATVGGLAAGALATGATSVYGAAVMAGAGASSWRVATGPAIMRLAPQGMRERGFSWNVALLVGAGAAWTALAGAGPSWIEAHRVISHLQALRWGMLLAAGITSLSILPLLLAGLESRAAWQARAPSTTRLPAPGAGRIPPPLAGSVDRRRSNASARLRDWFRQQATLDARLTVLVVVVAVWLLAGGLVIPFFNLYFQQVHGLTLQRIGVVFAASQAFTAVVIFASGEGAARLGARRLLAGWLLLFPPLLWGLGSTHSAGLALGLFLCQGLIPPATNPLIDQLLLERAPVERQGLVSGWRNAATELSGLVGAMVAGSILEAASFATLFVVAGLVALVGGAAVLLSLRVGATGRQAAVLVSRSALAAIDESDEELASAPDLTDRPW